ncbi:hypothetical protein H2198_007383 [Neophaeococcomyces mojaviensis]|uniref:Uncharacterized protein n=1 Tax=Neophaeococcomyces mojaviensis TaxID=3383035 RepID=A0ACC3A0M8_9EURO|nr:hypothetical protein H2198_007383 [Knufia sp. JES_112]
MSTFTVNSIDFYIGRRLSYEGSLCTVRWIGTLSGSKGTWLGVEWDDVSRGKHDGVHHGRRIFDCLSKSATPASFVKSARKPDTERTVLEAIRFKYGSNTANGTEAEAVIISGKVAEEVGFDKIAQEQAQLAGLKIVLVDQLIVNGVAPRGSSPDTIFKAQQELSETCPNIEELDLGFNVVEGWHDIADICVALPKLRTLRAGGLRFSSFDYLTTPNPFAQIEWLYVYECLVTASDVFKLLKGFTSLEMLNICGNQLNAFPLQVDNPDHIPGMQLLCLKFLYLDNNDFADLDCIIPIIQAFPNTATLSLGANRISELGPRMSTFKHAFPRLSTLSIPDNQISSFQFLDALPMLFPNLVSLRVTGNPFYSINTHDRDPKASDKLYYLGLARISTLKRLNYGLISDREREEGEIYYLSVAGKEIEDLFASASSRSTSIDTLAEQAKRLHPRYQALCQKYARDSVINQFLSSQHLATDPSTSTSTSQQAVYPSGSLGARLVTATFYIPTSHAPFSPTLTEQLPLTLPVSYLMAHLHHHPTFAPHLKPLQFNLVYESSELDPVDTTAGSSTRSAEYARGHRLTREEKENLWKEWGDWDADVIVEEALARKENHMAFKDQVNEEEPTTEEHWTADGFLMKNGRRWKHREVHILHSIKRSWGDWVDVKSGGPEREVKVRIEPFDRPTWGT